MRIKISFLFLFILMLCIKTKAASDTRSDTIDIRKTIIDFTITDFTSKIISAKTTLDFRSKMNNVSEVLFDLEGLIVDSVKLNGNTASYGFSSPTLAVSLGALILNINDTATIDVYYHGIPVADALWGGFAFVGVYAFQMGVGFNAQPHSFGRTWHPCFDNFVERCSYEFYITTNDTKAAICNGLLIDSTTNMANNTKRWHWKLDEEIPAYLASVAVSDYTFIHKNLIGNNGNIPALITCLPADTNKVHGSFLHLQESFSMLENRFGTYQWSRVGYSLVPFLYGAMEHATNIHIGTPFIDGTLNYETLIAHELSHHWWGDLVTCSTAGDMWLNEGFASYCAALHTEYVYGYQAYLDEIRLNHFDVLSAAHIDDAGYKAVANMDSIHTYGTTVYYKGEDMIHTLRSYMGDSLFFNTLTSFLNVNSFKAINTNQLRDYLTTQSGIDLTDYFANWISSPGFPHFSIDSTKSIANGSTFDVSVYIRQRKHKSTNYYNHVPIEVAFYDDAMMPHIYKVDFTGRCTQFNVNLSFDPKMIVLDPNSKISDAITEQEAILKNISTTTFTQAKCNIKVTGILTASDSSLIRIDHNWVAPDRFKNASAYPEYKLCDSRYWTVYGINLHNISGTLQFQYDAGTNNHFLDSTWIKNTDDSIRLFYRKDATEDWQFANDSIRPGSLTDKRGSIYAKEIKAGEYTFGIRRSAFIDPLVTDAPTGGCNIVTSTKNYLNEKKNQILLYPNPASSKITLQIKGAEHHTIQVTLFDMHGRKLSSKQDRIVNNTLQFDISDLPRGIYFVEINEKENGQVYREKIIKE